MMRSRRKILSAAAVGMLGLLTPTRVRVYAPNNGYLLPSIVFDLTEACADGGYTGPTCSCQDEPLQTCDTSSGKICRCAAEE